MNTIDCEAAHDVMTTCTGKIVNKRLDGRFDSACARVRPRLYAQFSHPQVRYVRVTRNARCARSVYQQITQMTAVATGDNVNGPAFNVRYGLRVLGNRG